MPGFGYVLVVVVPLSLTLDCGVPLKVPKCVTVLSSLQCLLAGKAQEEEEEVVREYLLGH